MKIKSMKLPEWFRGLGHWTKFKKRLTSASWSVQIVTEKYMVNTMDEEARYQIWLRNKINEVYDKLEQREDTEFYYWIPSCIPSAIDEEFWNLIGNDPDTDG